MGAYGPIYLNFDIFRNYTPVFWDAFVKHHNRCSNDITGNGLCR